MSQNRPDSLTALPGADTMTVAIVRAQWNGHITSLLADGCHSRLLELGLRPENITAVEVPGAVELTYAAAKIIKAAGVDAVIVCGCGVRGDTPHFDYVCQSVTQGVTDLNARAEVPVIFGVLTVEIEQQALDRCGGPAGHKGVEAADTAAAMIALGRQLGEVLPH